MEASFDRLKIEYDAKTALYFEFCNRIKEQIVSLLLERNVELAFPVECRVKTWNSIVDKCKRREFSPHTIEDIADIAGIRIITLFQRDTKKVCDCISKNFMIFRHEDTTQRLGENQFGYGSIHFEVSPPAEWGKVPTLKTLVGLKMEIQVRSASQHIWAAASHLLQYKNERDVPGPLKRSINRVSALLETVDLEFERVLDERSLYTRTTPDYLQELESEELLNSENLKSILGAFWPKENADSRSSGYSNLLEDLAHFSITSVRQLVSILAKQREIVLKHDSKIVQGILVKDPAYNNYRNSASRMKKRCSIIILD